MEKGKDDCLAFVGRNQLNRSIVSGEGFFPKRNQQTN